MNTPQSAVSGKFMRTPGEQPATYRNGMGAPIRPGGPGYFGPLKARGTTIASYPLLPGGGSGARGGMRSPNQFPGLFQQQQMQPNPQMPSLLPGGGGGPEIREPQAPGGGQSMWGQHGSANILDLLAGLTKEQYQNMLAGHLPGHEHGDFMHMAHPHQMLQALAHLMTQGEGGLYGINRSQAQHMGIPNPPRVPGMTPGGGRRPRSLKETLIQRALGG